MPRAHASDGATLHYVDWGAGAPVVLIHGWMLQSDSWSDLATVIAAAGLKNSSLVGFSMGAGEVLRYIKRLGGRGGVRAALIASIAPGLLSTADNPIGIDAAFLDQTKGAVLADRPGFIAESFPIFYGVGTPGSSVGEDVLAWVAGDGDTGQPARHSRLHRRLGSHRLSQRSRRPIRAHADRIRGRPSRPVRHSQAAVGGRCDGLPADIEMRGDRLISRAAASMPDAFRWPKG